MALRRLEIAASIRSGCPEIGSGFRLTAPTVFWGPMAFAIMGGLLVGTILTLVFLPTLYVAWFRGKDVASEKPADGAMSVSSKASQ
jgi:hypothetical protein